MSNIQPASNLQDYDKILSEVSYGNRIHITVDGKSAAVLIDEKELDVLDNLASKDMLLRRLKKSEARAEKDGWISEEAADKILEEA